MNESERFEDAWWSLCEKFAEAGREWSFDLLDKLETFHLNNNPREADMIRQIKFGLNDWYDKPEQRRPS